MKYIVLHGFSTLHLEANVKAYLDDGWQLQGGVGYDTDQRLYIQAMIKGE